MWNLQVINVQEYGAFFNINNFVHNAPIIFIFKVDHMF